DNRYCSAEKSYEGKSFWRGMSDYNQKSSERARINLTWVNTSVDQAIPILDFCWRNGVELHSADHDLHQASIDEPEKMKALLEIWPRDLFQQVNHWAYFSLNEACGDKFFPSLPSGSNGAETLRNGPENDLEAELRQVYGSLSWRATAPLRLLGRVL